MTDDPGAGASYLASLRRFTTPQAAGTAPATAINSSSPLPGMLPRPEKRRSARYRCQGSIHLREIQTGLATWASVTDISLNGCYVEIPTGYRVGTMLGLEIEVRGVRVAASGEVRVAYPGVGMGITFVKLSNTDRERLHQVIESLAESHVYLPPGASCTKATSAAFSSAGESNAAAVLEAITKFFDDRHVMGREEFFTIVHKSRAAKTL